MSMSGNTIQPPSAFANRRAVALCQRSAVVSAVLVFVVGLVVLLSWAFDASPLKSIVGGYLPMVPNTALAFALAGCSLWLLRAAPTQTVQRRTAQAAGLMVALIGALTLGEYLLGRQWGVDDLLFRKSVLALNGPVPGRPAFLAALNFGFLGAALLLWDARRIRTWLIELLVVVPIEISLLAVIGYACNVPSFYTWNSLFRTPMALHTTVAFAVLGMGLLCTRPERGLMKIVTSTTAGGVIARRLLLAPVLIPLITGLVRIAGLRAGIYNAEFSNWLFSFLNIFAFTGIIWWIATLLHRSDEVRWQAEEQVRQVNAQLEERVGQRTAELHKVQASLHEEKERLRLIIDTALDGVITMNESGFVTGWNRQAERIFGWEASEIVGQRLSQTIIPPRYRAMHEHGLKRFSETGEGPVLNRRIEITALCRNGSEIPVEIAITPMKIGREHSFGAFVRDITERKHAEEALLAAEAKFRRLVEQSLVGIYVIQDGRFVYVNPKMTEIFDFTAEELTSTPVLDLIVAEDRAVASENIRRRLEGTVESIHYALRMIRRDGKVIDVEVHGGRAGYNGQPAVLGTLLDVTERKRAEEALRQAEQKYRSIFDNASEGIFQTTRDGTFLSANPAMARIFGYASPEELIGERTDIARQGYVDPARREEFKRSLEANGLVSGFEYEAYRKDGSKIWISENVRAVNDRNGQLLYYEGTLQDITARKQTEEKMAWLASFPERSPNPILEIDAVSGQIHYINPFAARAFPQLKTGGFNHPLLEGLQETSRTLTEGKANFVRREVVVSERCYAQTLNYIPETRRLRVYSIDITDRKRAEAELEQQRKELELIFDTVPALIFFKDRQHRHGRINQALCRFLGRPKDAIEGRTDIEMGVPHHERYYRDDDEVISSGRPKLGIIEPVETARGTRWLQTDKLPYRDENGQITGLIGFAVDITERKRAEEEVRQLNVELERRVNDRTAELKEVVEELEAFSYSVSHDLRAPLRAMSGYARILSRQLGAQIPAEERELLDRIHDNAARMGELIDGLLTFSRLSRQPLTRRPIEPEKLVRRIFDELQQEIGGRPIKIEVGALPACQADMMLLHQVFFNLLSNALKYTRDRNPAVIKVGAQRRENQCVYFVQDNGAGFDMQYAERLFRVFQRLHTADQFEGTGVGLAIVHRIVHRHGGRIWAEAQVDHGATFYFTLGETEFHE